MTEKKYPKIHIREKAINEAGLKLSEEMGHIRHEHGLNDLEYLKLINTVLNTEIHTTIKYMISGHSFMLREERHGDVETPSGEIKKTIALLIKKLDGMPGYGLCAEQLEIVGNNLDAILDKPGRGLC